MKRIAILVMVVVLLPGCTGVSASVQDFGTECGDEQMTPDTMVHCVAREAESWIELTHFEAGEVDGGLAIYSFPDGPEYVQERTFLYDQALALLWFAWRGDYQTARRLAKTLVALQMEDGSWGFSFEAGDGGFYDKGYVRTGAMAWAGWAMAYYGEKAGDEQALASAKTARAYIETVRIEEESKAETLYGAGVGYHDPESGDRTLGEPVKFVSTEHQFDVYKFFRALDEEAAFSLRERMLDVLWLGEEGRFAMGIQPRGIDRRRALDTSGGWGALWLWSIGRPDLARASLEYTLEHFAATEASVGGGFVPYLDEVDGYQPEESLIFVEGSLGVALAAWRLERAQLAHQILVMAAELARQKGPGIPYADKSRGDFPATAAAAPTLWFLMVKREMDTGQRAPLFLP